MFTINCNGQGISSHLITGLCKRLGSRSVTLLNEPKAAAELQTFVPFVTYRMIDKGPGAGIKDDDYAQNHHDPVLFVNARHTEAPRGCALYLTNEPGDGNLDNLNDWTLRAVDRCVQLGRKPVPFNFQVLAPRGGVRDWKKVRPAGLAALQAGGRIGIHIYINGKVKNSLDALHVVEDVKEVFGDDTPIEVTEYAIAINYDPHIGYVGHMSEAQAVAECVEGIERIGDPRINYHWFIFGIWNANPSFAITNATVIQEGMVAYNEGVRMGQPTPQPVDYGVKIERGIARMLDNGTGIKAAAVHVRQLPSASAASYGTLKEGMVAAYWDTPRIAPDGKLWWQVQLEDGRIGYMSAGWVRFEPSPISEQPTDPPPRTVIITFPGSDDAAYNIWKYLKGAEEGLGGFARVWAEAFEIDTEKEHI